MAPDKLEKVVDEKRPFRMPWLDSCYQESILPTGPWEKVEDKICKAFAGKVEKQLTHPKRRQAIFELLGKEFVDMYYPEMKNDPTVLEPPETGLSEKRKLLIDAQNWLSNSLTKVTVETSCQRPKLVGDAVCEEIKDFVEHVQGIVTKGLDRHLYLQEQEFLNNLQRTDVEKMRFEKEIREEQRSLQKAWQEMERLRHAHPSLKGILKNPLPPPSRLMSSSRLSLQSIGQQSSIEERPVTSNVKGALLKMSEDPPPLSGMQSDTVGRSVVAVLKRDPRRYQEVVGRLLGRQLPAPLRSYVWMDVLLKAERQKLPDGNAERVVRERFGKSVSRGVSDLGIKRATHSPIASLIDHAVIEKYDGTPCMKPYMQDDEFMKSAARALNILYTYDRSYEPYLIYWLFPLQLAYQDQARETEHVYELALYLDLLKHNCFPSWPQIFGVAESVMNRLAQINPELEAHIVQVATINPRVNEKEFMVQLLLDEKQKSQEAAQTSRSRPQSKLPDRTESQRSSALRLRSSELLAHPLILLRKWIGEGFVGVLDTAAVLYVWDQCFMSGWSPATLENICVVLLQLISYKLIDTHDFTSLKDVFLVEPCKLYTKDIQRGLIHLQNNGDPKLVPDMNRRKPQQPVTVKSPTPPPASPVQSNMLNPVGIKNCRLEIVIPAAILERETVLDNLDVKNLTMECAVYFGSVQLATRSSTVEPQDKGVTIKNNGTKTYRVAFFNTRFIFQNLRKPKRVSFKTEKFVYENLNLSEMDVEQELGGEPLAVMTVKYKHMTKSGKNSKVKERVYPIGWCRIKLFHYEEGRVSGWKLMKGDCVYRLYPGAPPENVTTEHINVTSDILDRTSTVGALTYDPRGELKSPLSKQPSKTSSPQPLPTPWVPGVEDPFDLYIDALENIPDNGSIVKVSGDFLNTGEVTDLPQITAIPQITSSARNPRFHCKTTINTNKQTLNSDLLLLLKVFTVDKNTQEVAVIGSCLFRLFTQEGKLKINGHRRRLRSGILEPGEEVKSNALDECPAVPATTISIRLQEVSQEYVTVAAGDEYSLGDPALTASEHRLIESYRDDKDFPATVNDAVQTLTKSTKKKRPDDPAGWISWRLDEEKQKLLNTSTALVDLYQTVRYRQHAGISVKIHTACGLPEGLYVQCFARVLTGRDANGVPASEEGWGGDEKFVTLKHDYNSLQTRPEWLDEPTILHPHYDAHSVLMIQVFGVDMFYRPTAKHDKPGLIKSRDGPLDQLGEEALLGWAVLPLFKQFCVNSVKLTCPIVKGKPADDLISSFSHQPINSKLQQIYSDPDNLLTGVAVTASLWDGHFTQDELPYTLKEDLSQMSLVSDLSAYEEAQGQVDGKRIYDFVLDPLDWDIRQQGTDSDIFKTELEFHKKAATEKFIDIFDKALMDAGLGPL